MNPVLFLLPAVIVLLLAMPLVPVYRSVTHGGEAAGKKAKRSVIFNLCAFFGICLLAIVFPITGMAAPETAAPAAIGAFSENPKAFGKALIFVALGEGVALYGLLISILILNTL